MTHPSTDHPTLLSLIERQATATPEALALVMHERQWTYQELCAIVNQIANVLLAQGVRRHQRVGLVVERGQDTANALLFFLGIMQAAAVVVPLDISLPVARQKAIIQEAGITLLLVRRTH